MKAYVVEIYGTEKEPDVKYLGSNGVLWPVPVFWRSASTVREYLSQKSRNIGKKQYFNKEYHAERTAVFEIANVSAGFDEMTNIAHTYEDFMRSTAKKGNSLYGRGTAFKILTTAGWVSVGYHSTKYGKTWFSEQAVRAHISKDLHKLTQEGRYSNAYVYAYVIQENGSLDFAGSSPILQFYLYSKAAAERWAQFKRGSASLEISGNARMNKLLEKA